MIAQYRLIMSIVREPSLADDRARHAVAVRHRYGDAATNFRPVRGTTQARAPRAGSNYGGFAAGRRGNRPVGRRADLPPLAADLHVDLNSPEAAAARRASYDVNGDLWRHAANSGNVPARPVRSGPVRAVVKSIVQTSINLRTYKQRAPAADHSF